MVTGAPRRYEDQLPPRRFGAMDPLPLRREYAFISSSWDDHASSTTTPCHLGLVRRYLETTHGHLLFSSKELVQTPGGSFEHIWTSRSVVHATGNILHHLCSPYLHDASSSKWDVSLMGTSILTKPGCHHMSRYRAEQ